MTNQFKANFTYKVNTYGAILTRLVAMLIQVALWTALLSNGGTVQSTAGNVTLRDMVTYAVLSNALAFLFATNIVQIVGEDIRSGKIATDLMRPIKYKFYHMSSHVGTSAYNMVFQFLPMLLIGLIFFHVSFPGPLHFGLFILATANAFLINFTMYYLISVLSFWLLKVWQFGFLFQAIMLTFSGQWIPLWFFPDTLQHVASFLPFQLIYYFPLGMFLHKFEAPQILLFFAQQVLWIGILTVAESFVWGRAKRKLSIQGG